MQSYFLFNRGEVMLRKSLFFLVGFISSAIAQGATYYVCNHGSNNNSGTSPHSPWQTFDYAMTRFNSVNAGDSILFCRGGIFRSSFPRIANFKCRRDNRCTVGDYSIDGKRALPRINGSAGGVFNFQDGGNADHDEGYIVKNLSLRGIGTGVGVFAFNDVDFLTIDNLVIDGFSIGVFMAGANPLNPGADPTSDNIILKGSRIMNNSGQGWLGSGSNLLITRNKFTNNGFGNAVFNHNVYIGGHSANSNITVSNNILYKSAVINGHCSGVSLVVHGVQNGLNILNNLVYEDRGTAGQGCWGIAVDPGYAMEESFKNVVIANNTVSEMGNLSIGCASCVNVKIYANQITNSQAYGSTGIVTPDRAEDSLKSANVYIWDNIFNLMGPGKVDIRAPGAILRAPY